MFVAHAFHEDGDLSYTRGGFPTLAAATAQARTARHHSHGAGSWAVVQATMQQWAAWVLGDHSRPVNGPLRASGGAQRALAVHWPAIR